MLKTQEICWKDFFSSCSSPWTYFQGFSGIWLITVCLLPPSLFWRQQSTFFQPLKMIFHCCWEHLNGLNTHTVLWQVYYITLINNQLRNWRTSKPSKVLKKMCLEPSALSKLEIVYCIHFPWCLQAVYKSNSYLLIWNLQSLKFLLKGLWLQGTKWDLASAHRLLLPALFVLQLNLDKCEL